MTAFIGTAANAGGAILIVAGALLAAFRAPYALALLTGVLGLALVVGSAALLRRRAEQALQRFADAAGTTVTEHERHDEAAGTWLWDLGLVDLSRQAVRRVKGKSAEGFGGAAHLVHMRVGQGKSTGIEASILSAPARVAARLCFRRNGVGERSRAKFLGGAAATGTALDEHFLVYAEDPGAGAAAALDPAALLAILRLARDAGAGADLAIALAPGRATLYAKGTAAELFAPAAARSILEALSRL